MSTFNYNTLCKVILSYAVSDGIFTKVIRLLIGTRKLKFSFYMNIAIQLMFTHEKM